MTIHLYCLLAAPTEPPGTLRGIAGERVRALPAGRVTAWVGSVPPSSEVRSADVARRHDAVAGAALALGMTPLPARAGQRFSDDAACIGEIARREPEIVDALARVEGCVEMTLAFVLGGQPTGAGGSVTRSGQGGEGRGRRYLEGLRQRLEVEHLMQVESATVVAQVARVLGDLPVRETHSASGTSPTRLVISHLIPRASVARYRSLVGSLPVPEQARPRIGGPSAPYSFAALGP